MAYEIKRSKYPRTKHLPFSEAVSEEDQVLESVDNFRGQQVVVTEKLDGQNTTIYEDGYTHARSVDGKSHPSQHWLKSFVPSFSFKIPKGYRLCGENVYAKHTIFYEGLTQYFYLFSIWDETQNCLSWEDTVEWSKMLGVETVPVLYQGIWDEDKVKSCWNGQSLFKGKQEGYVVRLTSSFSLQDFPLSIGKFVSAEFKNNMSDVHWAQAKVVPNSLES